jgi:hypothetical protein
LKQQFDILGDPQRRESVPESGHEETAEGKARILGVDVCTAMRLMQGAFWHGNGIDKQRRRSSLLWDLKHRKRLHLHSPISAFRALFLLKRHSFSMLSHKAFYHIFYE